MTPAWLLDLLAAVMLAGAVTGLGRLAAVSLVKGRPWRPGQVSADADAAYILMAIAMAGMLAPNLSTLPDAAWAAVFGVLTAWFAGRAWLAARRGGRSGLLAGRCLLHLMHCAAMLYVFLAVASPAGGGMGGMSMGGPAATQALAHPTLAGAFVVLLVGYSVWDLDQLSGRRYRLATADGRAAGTAAPGPGAAARALVAAPATRVGWEVVLGITMAFMLVIMI